MKSISKYLIIILACMSYHISSYAFEKSFYILRSNTPDRISSIKKATTSLQQHAKQIDILITQAYQIDSQGVLSGFVDNNTMSIAKSNNIPIMLLITNTGFSKEVVKAFLSDSEAQTRAIQSILDLCTKEKYYGVQLDFENIPLAEKERLTAFYSRAAELLHKNGFKVSVAVVPLTFEGPAASEYLKRKYENWAGAYDLKALSSFSDFITIMTYDQHAGGTTPGPSASIPYMEAAIQHAIRYVPANKLSLGIPTYSGYWYVDASQTELKKHVHVNAVDVSHEQVEFLLKKYDAKPQWDDTSKVNYAIYQHNLLNEFIFIEDEQSFLSKIELANKYHLRGVSVFDLGNEDRKIWGHVG